MRFLTALFTSLVTLSALADTPTPLAEKPNILFIFADDMAYDTIGAHGHLDIDTPNLDRLVKNGTTFSHTYNMGAWGGAVCVASRYMLISGHSVWDANEKDPNTLAAEGKLWPQLMKKAGYDTYMTGKWHIPTSAPKLFDHSINVRPGMPRTVKGSGYNRPKSPEHYENGWKPWDPKEGGFWEGGKHWSEVTADDSITFINQAAKKETPFFMYLSFNAPHDPRQAPKEYIDQYPLDRVKVPVTFQPKHPHVDEMCGRNLRDEKLMPFPRTEYAVQVNRQEYFALISHMDAQIGRILDALDASGKADNTYIIFTADHGLAIGQHGLGGKQNMYDHSMRAPFMITGPGIEKGKTISHKIHLQDLAPTTLELAQAEIPESFFYRSLKPLLDGKDTPLYKSIYGAYMKSQRMVVEDNWKLIHLPKSNTQELYNLTDDPLETKDLANDPTHAAKKETLLKRLTELQKEFNDPLLNPAEPSKKKKKKKAH